MPKKNVEKESVKYTIECAKGHKSEYVPKNGKPADRIRCPYLVDGVPCKATSKIIDEKTVDQPPIESPDETKEEPTKIVNDVYSLEDHVLKASEDIKNMVMKIDNIAESLGFIRKVTKFYISYKKGKKQSFRIGMNKSFMNFTFNSENPPKDDRLVDRSKSVGDKFNYRLGALTKEDQDLVVEIIKTL